MAGYAQIRCWIKGDVILYDDLGIVLESRDPMGAKQITVLPGVSQTEADYDQVFQGTRAGDINEMMTRFASVIMTADTLLVRMRELLGTERLSATMTNLETASSEARKLFSENRIAITNTIETLHMISEKLARDSVDVKLVATLAVLDSSANQMNRLFEAIDNDGTLGKLIHDETLHNRLLTTTERLDSLISDIRRNPKKYLHFSLF
jgi:phospholipid/cholesterol/gamma-HCH transport system substrate-binding protein